MNALIDGERLALRRLRAADLPQLRAWDRDEEIARFAGQKFAGREGAHWLEGYRWGRAQALAIVERSGRLVGDLELEQINWRRGEAEMRICLGDKSLWNRGYGTEAVELLLRYAFERLRLKRIYLRVYRSNDRAIRCYEKCGFLKEGVLRGAGRRELGEDILLMAATASRFRRRQAAPASQAVAGSV